MRTELVSGFSAVPAVSAAFVSLGSVVFDDNHGVKAISDTERDRPSVAQ